MRRDEALAVRVDQINWYSNIVNLERRVITPDDPRRTPARVKTSGRPIPIDELAEVAERYVADVRQQLPTASKHPFLFVEARGGKPMTRSSVASVFRHLNAELRWLRPVTPHVLRHTWNDRFSERAEELKWSAEQEAEYRCLLMGWKDGSPMARRYTRKRQQRKAIAASRILQRRMFPRGPTP
jgi:integrase